MRTPEANKSEEMVDEVYDVLTMTSGRGCVTFMIKVYEQGEKKNTGRKCDSFAKKVFDNVK